MAGDWLKFEKATLDKPEVFAIADALTIDPDAVVGKLLRVWAWFDTHTEDGNAKSVSYVFLDRIAGMPGFCAAMESTGWMAHNIAGIMLPAFDKHTGKTAKARAETGRRVAAHRAQRANLPRGVRRDVFDRDGGCCVYCDRPAGKFTPPEMSTDAVMCMDHVIPFTRGGSDDIENLVLSCRKCNMVKSDRFPDEAGMRWPVNENGVRYGKTVTHALAKEEESREDLDSKAPKAIVQPAAPAAQDDPPDALPAIAPPAGPGTGDKAKPRRAQTAEHFPAFWAAYPVKKGKVDALKKWKSKHLDDIAQTIIAHVRMMEREDEQWRNGFIPHGSTYINGEGWNDEPKRPTDARSVTAPPPQQMGAEAALARTESKLDNALGFIRQRYERGEITQAQFHEESAAAKQKHRGDQ